MCSNQTAFTQPLITMLVQVRAFASLCWSVLTSRVHMQVQEENLQQAQVVATQAEQIEAVNKDLQDTQKLLAALQSAPCTVLAAVPLCAYG